MLIDEQFVEHFCDVAVDVFGAVVAVKAADDEGKIVQQRFEDRNQIGLADALAGRHRLEPGDAAVHGIDGVDPFRAVSIALAHASAKSTAAVPSKKAGPCARV